MLIVKENGKRYAMVRVHVVGQRGQTGVHYEQHEVPARLRNASKILSMIGHKIRQKAFDSCNSATVLSVDDWTGHVSNDLYSMTDDQAKECAKLGLYSLADWIKDGRGKANFELILSK